MSKGLYYSSSVPTSWGVWVMEESMGEKGEGEREGCIFPRIAENLADYGNRARHVSTSPKHTDYY